jgi:hypothetical protein
MRIVAFVYDPEEISKIMSSLNVPVFKAPEPIGRRPPSGEVFESLPVADDFEHC